MIPRRFRVIRPYLASFIHQRFNRPPVSEMVHWLTRSGKERRAWAFVDAKKHVGDYIEVTFKGLEKPFFYPASANWVDLCQTIDEAFNPKNWHHFVSSDINVNSDDIVVDCGAAEGLFSYLVAEHAARVYAIEPVPSWHAALQKTLSQFPNTNLVKVGVGHRNIQVRMTDNEASSRVCATGSLEIPICTIDSLFAEKNIPVTFIKADIEGFEFPMLLGAEDTIRRNRPKISMTVYHDENHYVEIQEYLRGIHSDYCFKTRGIVENGNPVLLQAY